MLHAKRLIVFQSLWSHQQLTLCTQEREVLHSLLSPFILRLLMLSDRHFCTRYWPHGPGPVGIQWWIQGIFFSSLTSLSSLRGTFRGQGLYFSFIFIPHSLVISLSGNHPLTQKHPFSHPSLLNFTQESNYWASDPLCLSRICRACSGGTEPSWRWSLSCRPVCPGEHSVRKEVSWNVLSLTTSNRVMWLRKWISNFIPFCFTFNFIYN